MSNNNMNPPPKKEKGWPYSEIYEKSRSIEKRGPRTSIFQFGTFKDLISNLGKLLGQNIFFYIPFSILGLLLFPNPEEWGGDQTYLAIHEIVKLGCYAISVYLAVKVFDDSNIADLGLRFNRRALTDFLVGLAIIFTVFLFNFILLEGAGRITIRGMAWERMTIASILTNTLATFIIFGFTGWSEELLSRGFQLRTISKGLNRPLGVILSSMLFAYMHRDNPGGLSLDYLLFIFLTGIMLSLAFLRTGQLWLAIGLHTGWNFFGGVIFSEGSIAGLKIFALIDIAYVNYPTRSIVIEVLLIAAIIIVVNFYTLNRKPEPLDW